MFSKFNWGHGIAIFYTVFVGVVVFALVSSFGVDHSLVVDDYYQKDIEYQSRYEKESRAMDLNNIQIKVDNSTEEIVIEFKDTQKVSGTALFYRPSDKSKDFSLSMDKPLHKISTNQIANGKWIVKMECLVDGEAVYLEETIYI